MGTVPSRLIKILRFGIKGAPWKIEIIHLRLQNAERIALSVKKSFSL